MNALAELAPAPSRFDPGSLPAADRLLPQVYEDLRRLAAARMTRESPDPTLQPTMLVHEAWLRLGGDRQPRWQNRAHFFAAAAQAMQRFLIDHARSRRAVRHGGGLMRAVVDADEISHPDEPDRGSTELHEALAGLDRHDARKAELVRQCYFVGLTLKDAAALLGISEPTARRDWAYARAWMLAEIRRLRGELTLPADSCTAQN
jgi:RNA polymerase sigma factor (TIGR02999 family)